MQSKLAVKNLWKPNSKNLLRTDKIISLLKCFGSGHGKISLPSYYNLEILANRLGIKINILKFLIEGQKSYFEFNSNVHEN